jgi:hypothetical protein
VTIDEIMEMQEEFGDEHFAAICGVLSGPAPFDMPVTAGIRSWLHRRTISVVSLTVPLLRMAHSVVDPLVLSGVRLCTK